MEHNLKALCHKIQAYVICWQLWNATRLRTLLKIYRQHIKRKSKVKRNCLEQEAKLITFLIITRRAQSENQNQRSAHSWKNQFNWKRKLNRNWNQNWNWSRTRTRNWIWCKRITDKRKLTKWVSEWAQGSHLPKAALSLGKSSSLRVTKSD